MFKYDLGVSELRTDEKIDGATDTWSESKNTVTPGSESVLKKKELRIIGIESPWSQWNAFH